MFTHTHSHMRSHAASFLQQVGPVQVNHLTWFRQRIGLLIHSFLSEGGIERGHQHTQTQDIHWRRTSWTHQQVHGREQSDRLSDRPVHSQQVSQLFVPVFRTSADGKITIRLEFVGHWKWAAFSFSSVKLETMMPCLLQMSSSLTPAPVPKPRSRYMRDSLSAPPEDRWVWRTLQIEHATV